MTLLASDPVSAVPLPELEIQEGPADVVLARCRPSTGRAAAAARILGVAAPTLDDEIPIWADLTAEPAPEPSPGPAEERPDQRHLRVVDRRERTPAQRRRRARAILLGSTILAVGIALALVYLHVVLAQRQFRLDNLNNQVQQEQLTYQKLRLQVAELGSPQNIISTAEGRLGMIQPTNVNYLSPNTTVAPTGSGAGTASAGNGAPPGDANWPTIKSQLAGSP